MHVTVDNDTSCLLRTNPFKRRLLKAMILPFFFSDCWSSERACFESDLLTDTDVKLLPFLAGWLGSNGSWPRGRVCAVSDCTKKRVFRQADRVYKPQQAHKNKGVKYILLYVGYRIPAGYGQIPLTLQPASANPTPMNTPPTRQPQLQEHIACRGAKTSPTTPKPPLSS